MLRRFGILSGLMLTLAALMVFLCRAQRYAFRDYVDRLGNLNVKCLYQDRTGFIWVGAKAHLS